MNCFFVNFFVSSFQFWCQLLSYHVIAVNVYMHYAAEKSSSGLIDFETLSEAVEGLAVCNHAMVENPGK